MSSMSRTFLEANTSDNFLSIDIDVHKPALNKALRVGVIVDWRKPNYSVRGRFRFNLG